MDINELEAAIPKIKRLDGEMIYLTLEIDPFEQCWVAEYKNEDYETRGMGTLSAMGNTIVEALTNLHKKLGL